MKFVSLALFAIILSVSASAQTTPRAAEKNTVAHNQQKTKNQKAKSSRTKSSAAGANEVVTLKDEKAHKAKWTFEELLKRRLEIDAEDNVAVQQKE